MDRIPTPSSSSSPPAQKRTKTSLTTFQSKSKTLTADSPLLPMGLDISGYDFQVNEPPTDRPVRIYCDGIYDLFHFGHAKALEQAKKSFPEVYLLVGVCSDAETHKRKGKTVMTDIERYESVRHCKWVDEVVEAAPWFVNQEFIDKYQIDYIAHDAEPYQSTESGDVYAFAKAQGRFLPTQRTGGISTSDLITRIVRDYDAYLRRNLERGVSAKELNISFLKEREIKTKKQFDDIKNQIKSAVMEHLGTWEDQSHNFIKGFAGRFGAEDYIEKFLNKRRLVTGGKRSRSPSSTPLEDSDSSPSLSANSSSENLTPLQ